MKAFAVMALLAALAPNSDGCDNPKPTSDEIQQARQEELLKEGTAQTGMPAIKNFRERKMLKDIIELRDQAGLTTYTYLWSDVQGKWVFFCNSVGYGIPYATEYTAPQKPLYDRGQYAGGNLAMPQADPNGLFSPASAEGTWILCKDPAGKETRPVYVEPRMIVSPFELPNQSTAVCNTKEKK